MKTWDNLKGELIETPEKLKLFFNEIEEVCIKYNFSISHEDGHGAFEIEEYDKNNIEWLNNAHKCFK